MRSEMVGFAAPLLPVFELHMRRSAGLAPTRVGPPLEAQGRKFRNGRLCCQRNRVSARLVYIEYSFLIRLLRAVKKHCPPAVARWAGGESKERNFRPQPFLLANPAAAVSLNTHTPLSYKAPPLDRGCARVN